MRVRVPLNHVEALARLSLLFTPSETLEYDGSYSVEEIGDKLVGTTKVTDGVALMGLGVARHLQLVPDDVGVATRLCPTYQLRAVLPVPPSPHGSAKTVLAKGVVFITPWLGRRLVLHTSNIKVRMDPSDDIPLGLDVTQSSETPGNSPRLTRQLLVALEVRRRTLNNCAHACVN